MLQRSSIAACPMPAHSPLLLRHSSLPFASLQTLKTPKTLHRRHQVPGRPRSSIAACPLPAHSPLLLGHSSLPFASLQTLKTPKTLHRRHQGTKLLAANSKLIQDQSQIMYIEYVHIYVYIMILYNKLFTNTDIYIYMCV